MKRGNFFYNSSAVQSVSCPSSSKRIKSNSGLHLKQFVRQTLAQVYVSVEREFLTFFDLSACSSAVETYFVIILFFISVHSLYMPYCPSALAY